MGRGGGEWCWREESKRVRGIAVALLHLVAIEQRQAAQFRTLCARV